MVAPVREVVDEYFGVRVVDPYRWMEGDSAELAEWMKAQAAVTRAALNTLPGYAELRGRVHALNNAGSQVHSVQQRAGRLFYLKRGPGEQMDKLCVEQGGQRKELVLIDPAHLQSGEQNFSIDYFAPSPDGELVAFGLSRDGSELAVIHIVAVATGQELPEAIDRARWAMVSWRPDSRAFFYRRSRELPGSAPESERFSKAPVHLHEVGTPVERDVAVFGYGVSQSIDVPPDPYVFVRAPASSPFLFAVVPDPLLGLTIYSVRRQELSGARTPWKKLIEPTDGVAGFEVHGDMLFIQSERDATRARILRTSASRPDMGRAVVVMPESSAVIREMVAAKDALYVQLLDAGIGRVARVDYATGQVSRLELPVDGTISELYAAPGEHGALFVLTSWTLSPRLFRYDPGTKQCRELATIPASPVDYSGVISRELTVKASDGTAVPLSIIQRADRSRAQPARVVLEAYGAYGVVAEPQFDPMLIAWLERGGIHAVCHPRGGGEHGTSWYDAGRLANKPNTIADVLACAEYLVAQGYASMAGLAAEGFSAGTIAVAGAVNRRPELFGAAILRVGMFNALRFEQMPIGPNNTSEFGTVQTSEGLEMLRAIDAYHHVAPGIAYPAMLLTTGIADPRVSPWQAAKMTARLQAATASKRPVYLRVDYGSGHGTGSSEERVEVERADKYAFLLSQLVAAP